MASIDLQSSEVIEDRLRQKTICNSISCYGIGLHSGLKIKLTLKPSDVDTGIIFYRTDIAGNGACIKADYNNVVDTRLCTCIGDGKGNNIATVEHLMSAIHALGITNLRIEVSGPEVPILDGSSSPFIFLLNSAGLKLQDSPLKAIKVKKSITVEENGSYITFLPSSSLLNIDFTIDYGSSTFIVKQHYLFSLESSNYIRDISSARTFGLASEVEQIKSLGLAKGGSLDNVLVVTNEDVLNPEGLRYEDEFVRHKILDAIGDIFMSGYTMIGTMIAYKSGHRLNNIAIRKLLSDKDAWELVEVSKNNHPIILSDYSKLAIA